MNWSKIDLNCINWSVNRFELIELGGKDKVLLDWVNWSEVINLVWIGLSKSRFGFKWIIIS